jgi:hypothetical protein
MTHTYLALAVQEPSGWVPVFISVLALIATLGNYLVTLWRGRKHVRLTSHIRVKEWELDSEGEEADPGFARTYICNVTNTGFVGATIERVYLSWQDPGLPNSFRTYTRWRTGRIQRKDILPNRVARLQLLEDEDLRKLDPGESQKWGVPIDGVLKARILMKLHRHRVGTNGEDDIDRKGYYDEDDIDYIESSTETDKEEPERAEPHSATGEAQEGVLRPWWRRVFGRGR